ncbi:MAG: hypothetical protein OEZ36_07500 [Spirochaetota bacterium]|nr:hypothetical protein [Spirochaetota bacterium]
MSKTKTLPIAIGIMAIGLLFGGFIHSETKNHAKQRILKAKKIPKKDLNTIKFQNSTFASFKRRGIVFDRKSHVFFAETENNYGERWRYRISVNYEKRNGTKRWIDTGSTFLPFYCLKDVIPAYPTESPETREFGEGFSYAMLGRFAVGSRSTIQFKKVKHPKSVKFTPRAVGKGAALRWGDFIWPIDTEFEILDIRSKRVLMKYQCKLNYKSPYQKMPPGNGKKLRFEKPIQYTFKGRAGGLITDQKCKSQNCMMGQCR